MSELKRTGTCGNLALMVAASAMLITLAGCNNLTCPTTKPQPGPSMSAPWPTQRKPLTDRTLVFSRAQMKYSLSMNYAQSWLDRPLFHDRSMRPESSNAMAMARLNRYNGPDFPRMMDIARTYGIDGFAFYPQTAGRLDSVPIVERNGRGDFHLLPELISSDSFPAKTADVLEKVMPSPAVIRVNGKVCFTFDAADAYKPEELRQLFKGWRAKYGDKFIILGALDRLGGKSWYEWHQQTLNGKPISEADHEKINDDIRTYLDICDGLYFHGGLRKIDCTVDVEFYRDTVIAAYQNILAEPKYKDKYLGLFACLGYFQPGSGSTTDDDGTRTLRQTFETALNAGPDIINLPEWDEQNENTFFRPTVYNSFSTQRILKYYMHRIKGERPMPNQGDDLALPNLVISYRKILSAGERLRVELLNVPDGGKAGNYTVILALKDLRGAIVKQSPEYTFAASELKDHVFDVPTEEIAANPVLIPSLAIKMPEGKQIRFEDGLHYIQLRATWNWDYKWVKQSLRDICRPLSAEFAFTGKEDPVTKEKIVKGAFACDEKIAQAEVVEDGDVVYAVDRNDEFFRDGDDILLAIECRALRGKDLKGTVTIENAPCKWPEAIRRQTFAPNILAVDGNTLKIVRHRVGSGWWPLYVAIPRKYLDQANILIDFNIKKMSVPVKRIMENGIYAESNGDGATIYISRFYKQPDIPVHVDLPEVKFTARVTPETITSVFHMRVITKSGKIYCSKPLVLPEAGQGPETKISAYSGTAGKAVAFTVKETRVPCIIYDFTPRYGTVLHTSAGRPFYGTLGGNICAVIGRGGEEGGANGTPFYNEGKRNYPAAATNTAPSWVMEDGQQCLKFDGGGNYLLLPIEAIPKRANFTLTFEIKPMSKKTQVLFAHHGYYIGSLVIKLKNGMLKGSYCDQYCKGRQLDPKLSLEIGKWSKVEVVYDQEQIAFKVNDQAAAPIPCPGPGLYINQSVFGGFGTNTGAEVDFVGDNGWFEGYLKSLSIRHMPPTK